MGVNVREMYHSFIIKMDNIVRYPISTTVLTQRSTFFYLNIINK